MMSLDPFMKKQKRYVSHQEFRNIKVGPEDMLKNGQMVQVAVCDAFDDEKFHEADKVLLMKHQDVMYATGSFCGYDFTNLSTGALMGEKLICPTCESAYDIKTGQVD